MTFECEECGKKSTTEAGLALHMKVYHKEAKTQEKPKKASKKANTPKKSTKKAKAEESELISPAAILKESAKEAAEMKKKFKQRPTGIENNQKVTKTELKKIFPAGMRTRLIKSSTPAEVHDFLEGSYTAIVLINNNGWRRVRLLGKTTKVNWAEGPMPSGKYKVTYPTLYKS